MAKKSVIVVDAKYLETKLKSLKEQQSKVESILDQYSELWTKLLGAIESTQDLINELTVEDKVETDESK